MSENQLPAHEQLPSGKTIMRQFSENGILAEEMHSYGVLDIAVTCTFSDRVKTDETYIVNNRMASRRSYEKARLAYADMPTANCVIEDTGALLLQAMRKQQRRNKSEAERRLAESAESRYPRPASTNWLRVISGEKAHLVVFASRDWKVLSRERTIRSGREWMRLFGFYGPPGKGASVAKGVEFGFEVPGDTQTLLNASQSLLTEVTVYVKNPPEISRWQGSIRPQPKPRKKPPLAWPTVLPPLIDFLSSL
jgi:hypothetical protein